MVHRSLFQEYRGVPDGKLRHVGDVRHGDVHADDADERHPARADSRPVRDRSPGVAGHPRSPAADSRRGCRARRSRSRRSRPWSPRGIARICATSVTRRIACCGAAPAGQRPCRTARSRCAPCRSARPRTRARRSCSPRGACGSARPSPRPATETPANRASWVRVIEPASAGSSESAHAKCVTQPDDRQPVARRLDRELGCPRDGHAEPSHPGIDLEVRVDALPGAPRRGDQRRQILVAADHRRPCERDQLVLAGDRARPMTRSAR